MSNNNDYGLNWTVEEVNEFVSETYNRDVILSLILNYSVAHLIERCILIVGTDTVQGHCASDWPGMPDQDVLRKIRSALPADSSIHEGGIRIGAPKHLGLTTWFEAIGVTPPESVGLVPIPISGRVAISIMGVPRLDADLEALRVLGETMGRQLEKVIKMAKARTLPPEDERVPGLPASVIARSKKNDTSQFPFAEAESDVSVETGHASEVEVRKDRTMEAKRPRPLLSKFPFREVDDEAAEEVVSAPNSTQRITAEHLRSIHDDPPELEQKGDNVPATPTSEATCESSVAWAISEGDIVPSEFEPVSPKLDEGPVEPPPPPTEEPVANDEVEPHVDDAPADDEVEPHVDADAPVDNVAPDEQAEPQADIDAPNDDVAHDEQAEPQADIDAPNDDVAHDEQAEPQADIDAPEDDAAPEDAEVVPQPIMTDEQIAAMAVLDRSAEDIPVARPEEDDEELELDDEDVVAIGPPGLPSEASEAIQAPSPTSDEEDHGSTLRGIRMPGADDEEDEQPQPEPMDSGGAGATSFGLPLPQVSVRTPPKADASSTVFGLPLMSPDESAETPATMPPVTPDVPSVVVRPEVDDVDDAPADVPEEPALPEPSERPEANAPVADNPAAEEPALDDEPAETPGTIVGIPPNEIGDERSSSSRTLMGGIEANVDLASFGKPASVNETLRGGFDPVESAPSEEAPRSSVNETLRGGIEPVLPEPQPQEDDRTFVPGALILKRAKLKRKAGREPVETPIAASPVAASAPRASIAPVRHAAGQTLEIGRESSNSTLIGMRAGKVKDMITNSDEWFDELGDSSPQEPVQPKTVPASRAALDDDPRTIPPEALERILESQPLDIEVQEAFLLLDDRNRNVAFEAADVVASAGPAVLEGLAAMFPGRLFIDRYQHTFETMPPVGDHGPLLHVLVRLGEDALPVCKKFVNDTSLEARFYAMLLLTQISAEGLLEDVFTRLFDRDQQIRNIARSVAMAYQSAPNFRSALLDPLRNRLRVTKEELHIDVCTDLLTRLRDVASIPLLMEQLGKHREHTNKNIHTSLQLLTFHNWSSPYEWKQWWATAKEEARYLWLVAAMDSQSDQLRALAFEELQLVPGLETNYQPEQPSKLRQREQKVVEEWFQKNV